MTLVTQPANPVPSPPQGPQFSVGDLVTWKSFQLVVIELKEDGTLDAMSPTMRVNDIPANFTPQVI